MPRIVIADGRNGQQRVTTDLSLAQAVEILRGIEGNAFAASLAADHYKYRNNGGLKGNRAAWAIVVAQKSLDARNQPAQPAAPTTQVGGYAAIIGLLNVAGSRLKYPKITLATTSGRTVQLSVAGSGSRYAGQVTVNNGEKFGTSYARFFGRIDQAGSSTVSDPEVLDLLREFAADPAGVAAAYGHRTGNCCFCKVGLTDERSLSVGYGPICAGNYGLPWGNRPGRGPAQPATPEPVVEQRGLLDFGGQPDLEAEYRDQVGYAEHERRVEEAGFLSDPDYRRSLQPVATPVTLDWLMGRISTADIGRDDD